MMGRTISLNNDSDDYHRVYAVMVFPDDALFRTAYMRMLVQQRRIVPTINESEQSWDLPRWKEIKAAAQKSVRSGILAGDYLAIWSVMDAHGMREPSSRRAAQAVERFRKGATYRNGAPFRATSRKVESTDFAMHRNSAHLWAALHILIAKHGPTAHQRMHHPNGLKWFLRHARYVQDFGVSQMTPRTNLNRRHSLLDATAVWRVPATIHPIKPRQVPFFNQKMKAILGGYQSY